MSLIAKQENEGGFNPIPEGVHTAVCYGLIDLGMQYSEKFDKKAQKVLIMWELPDETYKAEDGEERPRMLSKEYTMSLHEKSGLRKDLQAWRGRAFTDEELAGFDLINILGKGCQIQIIHKDNNGKTYANIASIMGLPKGMVIKKPESTLVFDLDSVAALHEIESLPQWIQDKIKMSETYQELKVVESGMNGIDGINAEGDLPF